MLLATGMAGCGGGDYSAQEDVGPRSGPQREINPWREDSVFGEGGLNLQNLSQGRLFGGDAEQRTEGIPVNRYLWQASLDTLSFLPLASTDPFTGVIATDWGATPDAPGERFKVTAYLLSTELQASALKVAVFRERLTEDNVWVPAQVDPATPRQLEDAILTRARQMRMADVGADPAG